MRLQPSRLRGSPTNLSSVQSPRVTNQRPQPGELVQQPEKHATSSHRISSRIMRTNQAHAVMPTNTSELPPTRPAGVQSPVNPTRINNRHAKQRGVRNASALSFSNQDAQVEPRVERAHWRGAGLDDVQHHTDRVSCAHAQRGGGAGDAMNPGG